MKKLVLLISVVGMSLILLRGNSVDLQLCEAVDTACRLGYSTVWKISLFFPLILLFSIITYWMPTRVFKSWLTFLLISGPLILLITSFIHIGFLLPNTDMYVQGFGMLVIFILYGIFILGSVISIVRGYKANRQLG